MRIRRKDNLIDELYSEERNRSIVEDLESKIEDPFGLFPQEYFDFSLEMADLWAAISTQNEWFHKRIKKKRGQ